ncbi:DUF6600 domain-containing protein [Sphingobacterium sp. HJSM2_6]|uniref:DUF6600 domain-containing protein n=1 Tax=Sphingobacterium sp. HJSM2_6 TaxID=3366264 RepID=UPI003BD2EC04
MKNLKSSTSFAIAVFLLISIFSVKHVSAQNYNDLEFDDFYNELRPYGDWDSDPEYGNVWYPNEGSDFRPYGSNGYWTMTEYGNTWVSNYDWGWAPFHYGRWVHRGHRGWAWIPGYEWGPAWVDWRTGGGYYGWAPMGPRINVSVNIGLPVDFWIFLPTRRIYEHHMPRYWSYGHRNIYNRTTIIHNTYIVNNNRYYGGPARRDIERHIGRRVDVRSVNFDHRRGSSRVDRNSVSIYRPDRSSSRSERINDNRNNRDAIGRSNRSNQDRATVSRGSSTDRNNTSRSNQDRGSRGSSNDRNSSSRSSREPVITRNANGQREMRFGSDNAPNRSESSRSNEQRTVGSRAERSSNTGNVSRNSERTPTASNRGNAGRESRSNSNPVNRNTESRSSSSSRSNIERPTRNESVERSNRSSRSESRVAPQRQSAPVQRQQSAPGRSQESRSSSRVYQTSAPQQRAESRQQSRPSVERSSGSSRSQSRQSAPTQQKSERASSRSSRG